MAQDMLFSGESKNIEYKVTVPDKSEQYMKTVVAFANGNGGRIVFGIDDKTLKVVVKGNDRGDLCESVRNNQTSRRIYVERTDFGWTKSVL